MIYPEIFTDDNTLAITDNGDGTITINPNQVFGIKNVQLNTSRWSDADRTFAAEASKTYHLRFSLNGTPINSYTLQPLSFYLVDVADVNYNPNGVDETDAQFDTQYDDMLIAKIESDANNVATTTKLKNKARIVLPVVLRGVAHRTLTTFALNVSRKPSFSIQSYSHTIASDWGIWDDDGEIRMWKYGNEIGADVSTSWLQSVLGIRVKGSRYSGSILWELPQEDNNNSNNTCDIKLIVEV